MQAAHRFLTRMLAISTIVAGSLSVTANEPDRPLIVFAAASLTGALNETAKAWSTNTGQPIPAISISASAILARQIEAGAPADIFISANETWSDYLTARNLTEASEIIIARNQLVFARRLDRTTAANGATTHLAKLIKTRFAIADPNIAPAGQYAKQALQSLGLWKAAHQNIIYGGNARQTLALVERADVPGFLYGSDVACSDNVTPIVTIPQTHYTPITYRAVVVKHGEKQAISSDFIEFLAGPEGQKILVSYGFQPR